MTKWKINCNFSFTKVKDAQFSIISFGSWYMFLSDLMALSGSVSRPSWSHSCAAGLHLRVTANTFIISSILTSPFVPASGTRLHSKMLPPPCLTIGVVVSYKDPSCSAVWRTGYSGHSYLGNFRDGLSQALLWTSFCDFCSDIDMHFTLYELTYTLVCLYKLCPVNSVWKRLTTVGF